MTATAPVPTTVHSTHGCQDGVRSSTTTAVTTVTATVAASTARPSTALRRRQAVTAPIPTSAAIGGASTTV